MFGSKNATSLKMIASIPSRGGAEEMEDSLISMPSREHVASAAVGGIYKGAQPPSYTFSLVHFFGVSQRNEQ